VKFGVVVFPGSNCDSDAFHACRDVLGQPTAYLWHKDHDLQGVDCVILPGGFSYGDYLRSGAIARFSPLMREVRAFAAKGGLVLGIYFICRDQTLKVENVDTSWTSDLSVGQEIVIPLKNGEGGFVADADTVERLEGEGRVVFRYVDVNPNGSVNDIAGITNEAGNVLGLMPHPEHAVEGFAGSTDGLRLFQAPAGAAA